MIKRLDGLEINESDMVYGKAYRRYNGCGGYIEFTYEYVDIIPIEIEWVVSELSRTDKLVLLPDYPYKEIILAYRDELRQYDYNGDRPITPTTSKGTTI